MLFNSLGFAVFLPVVFILYWFVAKTHKTRNILLLASSYFFYSCWDWRFLFILMFSTLLDYYTAIKINGTQNAASKKIWFWTSIIINLGFLAVFKYYNFFAGSFAAAVSHLGWQVNPVFLSIILPVGISFYTFHGLSYIIDNYKGRIEAEKNPVDYALFVSYFPLLVAGPIERATHLLPQLKKERFFNYGMATNGLRQILWGLFKKVAIADNCAGFANIVFDNPSQYPGSTLALGALFFSLQIYGDFSGYSDIALGTSRLFGIELLKNFSFPYFSRDIAEFWRRWHISLSSWFRDYLYIPLGGSRTGTLKKIRNTFIIFIVSGFWHGANWTFIAWGALHALYFLPLLLTHKNRANMAIVAQGKLLPSLKECVQIVLTFCLTSFAWIFFRAKSIAGALDYINRLFSKSLFTLPKGSYFEDAGIHPYALLLLAGLFMLTEWLGREGEYALQATARWPKVIKYTFYYFIIFLVCRYAGAPQQFIYFQF